MGPCGLLLLAAWEVDLGSQGLWVFCQLAIPIKLTGCLKIPDTVSVPYYQRKKHSNVENFCEFISAKLTVGNCQEAKSQQAEKMLWDMAV